MAYDRKEWKSRQGTGLNKYKLEGLPGDPVVRMQNAPDSVTQQGDTLDAAAMNDLEGRIADAFGATGAGTVALSGSSGTLTSAQYAVLTASDAAAVVHNSHYAPKSYEDASKLIYSYSHTEYGTQGLVVTEIEIAKSGLAWQKKEVTVGAGGEIPHIYRHSVLISGANNMYVSAELISESSTQLNTSSLFLTELAACGFTSISQMLSVSGWSVAFGENMIACYWYSSSQLGFKTSSGRTGWQGITGYTVTDYVSTIQ